MRDDRPIIIIKKKGPHAGHHGGAWKVAYADFVTAMMAFFLVMWILGLSQETRKSIAQYFKDPAGVMARGGGTSPLGVGTNNAVKPGSVKTLKEALDQANENTRFQAAKKELDQKLASLPEFKNVRQYVEITLTPDGLRIELLEGSESLFFESGSANLKDRTVSLLHLIAQELAKLPNSIVMEGHTDAQPYAGGQAGYSNWELSSDRANAARRAMVAVLKQNQVVEVRGYAAEHLRDPAHPFHFSNRRVSILVRYSRPAGADERADLAPDVAVTPEAAGGSAPDIRPSFKDEYAAKQSH